MTGVLRLPDEIRFAPGASVSAADEVARLGARALVVADPFLATTEPFGALIARLEELAIATSTITDVPPELPVDAVEQAGASAASFAPDVIVGYGGGSAIDAAKLIAVYLAHGGPLSNWYGEHAVPGPVAPIVAIPTTAGTGSEVTPVAVVSDPGHDLKVGVSSPHLIPRVAVVDPLLTVGAPPSVTAHSGIDALVHAVESYTAAPLEHATGAALPVFVGRNALADPLALEAAGLLYRNLPAVLDTPGDTEARSAMARGSLLAGMSFGSTGTHLSHAMQYAVGAMTKTPHGLGTGALLPYVCQVIREAVPERLTALGVAMGVVAPGDDADTATASQRVVDAIAALCERIGLPVALSDIGLSQADVSRAATLTMNVGRLLALSPVEADEALLTRVLSAAVAGDRARLG